MVTVNHGRSFPLTPISLAFAVVLAGSLSVVNVYPRVYWGHINYYLIDGAFVHGWPLVYMRRDCKVTNADMGGIYHGAWPFEKNPGPIHRFRFDFLLCDVLLAVLLVALSVRPIELLLRRRNVRCRFSLAMMLTIIAVVCIVLAVQYIFPLHLFALHLIPNCVVILSLALLCLYMLFGFGRGIWKGKGPFATAK